MFRLVAELRNLFDQDYEVQTMHISLTTVVQARKSSTLRELTASPALTIRSRRKPRHARRDRDAEMAGQSAVARCIATFRRTPDALPALGAYWQYRLTKMPGR